MAIQKLSGNTVSLGGVRVLTAPIIYGATYSLMSTSSTGVTKIYGVPKVMNTTTDTTAGGINFGGMTQYIKKIHLSANYVNSGGTSLKDTSWDAPYGSIIEDVFIDTVTQATCATLTLSVGIAGSANGLLTSFEPIATWTPVHDDYGTLLLAIGTSDAQEHRVPYYTKASTTRSVTVSRSSTKFSATFKGNLFIKYLLPSS